MAVLIIRSNLDTSSPVFIPDLGFYVPPSGGQEIFVDVINLQDASSSVHLRVLCTDSAFVGGTDPSDHTLILNDGTVDIAPEDVDYFLENLVTGSPLRVYNEPLAGTIDGANKVFTTSTAFIPGTEVVLFNGVTQREGLQSDYIRAESVPGGGYDTVQFAVAPRSRPSPREDDSIAAHFDVA